MARRSDPATEAPGGAVAAPGPRDGWRPNPAEFGDGLPTLACQPLFEGPLVHAFTLQPANVSIRSGQDQTAATRRREQLCGALGADPSKLTTMRQVHGARIALVDDAVVGGCLPDVDGLIVDRPGIPLLALSSDCPLILVADADGRALGLAHAGWRGTLAGIARALVRSMIERLGVSAGALRAAIAPSAGVCCYRVGPDVWQAAEGLPQRKRFFQERDGAMFFDLGAANGAQLIEAGIDPQRVHLSESCTICDDRFFSYRRDGADTGHAGLIAVLR
ncbi:MAG: laccase domain-containing protein [Planctomycetes bacterium]|nr:laccase domain-containing protein [Planctomycetota bacterium]